MITGKVLADEMTLAASEINNGAKVMLMASQGLYQGVVGFSIRFFSIEVFFLTS